MSKNTSPRFITATCKCGNKFEREVKRGRPQVWCPSCVLVPFYDRPTVAATVAVVMSATGEVVVTAPVADRIVNVNDPFDSVRAEIEAEIALINAEHKEFFKDLVDGGMDRHEAGPIVTAMSAARMTATYAKYK